LDFALIKDVARRYSKVVIGKGLINSFLYSLRYPGDKLSISYYLIEKDRPAKQA